MVARRIYTRTSPKTMFRYAFEELLFLKVNRLHWNEELVCEAMMERRTDRVDDRLASERVREDLVGGDE